MCALPSSRQSKKKSPIVSSYHFGWITSSYTLSGARSIMPVELFQDIYCFIFHLIYPNLILDKTAVGKALKVRMVASGWKYIGDRVSRTHSLMD